MRYSNFLETKWANSKGTTKKQTTKMLPLLAAFITIPTSTPTDLTAQITDQIGDVGTLAVLVLVAGIPLFFYVVKKVIGLIPKR